MAAVKPVEYIQDSSTKGFATAGNKKEITKSNANTIQKDADQGFTKELDAAQERQLDKYVDDDIDYTDEEMKNVGKQQIDTKGEDGEDVSEKNGKGGAITATVGSAGSIIGCTIAILAAAKIGKLADGCAGLVCSIVAMTCSAVAFALSFPKAFDANIDDRKNQTDAAEGNNQIMQGYTDEITSNMDSMTTESEEYNELCATKMENDINKISEVGALQAEMATYNAQGNTGKAAEIKGKIDKLQEGDEGDSSVEEMNGIKENLEVYRGKNAEAVGVAESGSVVSKFLKDGRPMERMAKACAIMQTAVALTCLLCIVKPKWIFDTPPAGIATAMFIACGVLGLASAALMKSNATKEGEAADAGDGMSEYVAALSENAEAGEEYVGSTEAGYLEADTVATEETGKAQEGSDKALEKQQKGFVNSAAETGDTTPTVPTTPAADDTTADNDIDDDEDELVA